VVGPAGRQLVHVGLADDDRAGFTEPLYHEGVRGCDLAAEGLAAPGGFVLGHVEQFLDQDGYAVQRPDRSGRKGARRTQRLLGEELTRGVRDRLPVLERTKSVGDQFDRADATFPDRAAHVDERDG
jgi:hypothetical protein